MSTQEGKRKNSTKANALENRQETTGFDSMKARRKVQCPYCGYRMPILYNEHARCEGIFVRCKNRKCKREFEIIKK